MWRNNWQIDAESTWIVAPGRDGVKILDIETGEVLADLSGAYCPQDVAISPDGTLVLTVSLYGVAELWNAWTGIELLSFGAEGAVNQARFSSCCFSPCGRFVAMASGSGMVELWRTRDGLFMAMFSEHEGLQVCFVAFTPDGEALWSVDCEGKVSMRRIRDIVAIEE